MAMFLTGGTMRIEGHGERVLALPGHPRMHIVILCPDAPATEGKTGLMYRSLSPQMFTTGQFVRAAEYSLQQGERIPEELMFNVFEKVAGDIFPAVSPACGTLEGATGARAHLAGSGPCLYALLESAKVAEEAVVALRAGGLHAYGACTLGDTASAFEPQ